MRFLPLIALLAVSNAAPPAEAGYEAPREAKSRRLVWLTELSFAGD